MGVIVIAVFLGAPRAPGLSRLPLQLFPDIKPTGTGHPDRLAARRLRRKSSRAARAPRELMQGMPGVEEIEGNAFAANAQVNLRFRLERT